MSLHVSQSYPLLRKACQIWPYRAVSVCSPTAQLDLQGCDLVLLLEAALQLGQRSQVEARLVLQLLRAPTQLQQRGRAMGGALAITGRIYKYSRAPWQFLGPSFQNGHTTESFSRTPLRLPLRTGRMDAREIEKSTAVGRVYQGKPASALQLEVRRYRT